MADCYQVMSRYSRKTYKKRREPQDSETSSPRDDNCECADLPRYNTYAATIGPSCGKTENQVADVCKCDVDTDGNLTNLLHKKCPVITLARRQLERLQNDSEIMFQRNARCCRSLLDIICICKECVFLANTNKSQFVLIMLIGLAFLSGLILGAASCGAKLGHFNSPILTCIDNYFIPDTYTAIEQTFRSIV